MQQVLEIDLKDKDLWIDYLNRFKKKDIYFDPNYYQLYEEIGDGTAKCFVYIKDQEVALYPFLVNEINSEDYNLQTKYFDIQGAYGYNGALFSSNTPEFIDDFNKIFNSYCQEKNIIAEFTRFHPLLNNQIYFNERLNIFKDRETVFLNLQDDFEHLWNNEFTSKNRNMIRKAQKTGHTITIIEKPTKKELDLFIEVYYQNMQLVKAEEYFYFNRNYFYNTFKYLGSHSYLFHIRDKEDKLVTSSLFFKYGDFFHYHLSGRKVTAHNSVNNFLISEAIKFAKDLGAKFFHLGGGRSALKDDSLLKFKKSFSTTCSNFFIGKKVHNEEVYKYIVEQWNSQNTSIKEEYKNYLLKYRINKK